jgi:hypothetical protein
MPKLRLMAQDLEANGIDERALRRCVDGVLVGDAREQVVRYLHSMQASGFDTDATITVKQPPTIHAYDLYQ